jgi:hypothetical protein
MELDPELKDPEVAISLLYYHGLVACQGAGLKFNPASVASCLGVQIKTMQELRDTLAAMKEKHVPDEMN